MLLWSVLGVSAIVILYVLYAYAATERVRAKVDSPLGWLAIMLLSAVAFLYHASLTLFTGRTYLLPLVLLEVGVIVLSGKILRDRERS